MEIFLVCEKPQCNHRYLCALCQKDPHFQEHKYSISPLNEFIFKQNKKKSDMIYDQEVKLIKMKEKMELYEQFITQTTQQIDNDFNKMIEQFNKYINVAKGYLKQHIQEDIGQMIKVYQKQKLNFRRLKENILKQNQSNVLLVNFQAVDLKQGIEQLVQKNRDVNKEFEDIREIEDFINKKYDDKIHYNINENTQLILDDLFEIFSKFSMVFLRKFKMLMVRPSSEKLLNSKLTMIRNKLHQQLLPQEQENQESQNTTLNTSLNTTLINAFQFLKNDLEIVERQSFSYPEYVLYKLETYGEFQSAKKIDHKSFKDLVQKPSVLLEDGSIYEGEWSSNETRTGRGKCLFTDGTFYDGYWVEGEPSIVGRFIYKDGSLYEGLVKKGKKHGKGVLIGDQGYKYVGYFMDNKKHGQGEEDFPDGTHYKGEFQKDQHQGKGFLMYSNNSKYEGEFLEGKFNGEGSFEWQNGEKYVGQWYEDKKHGYGSYYYIDGRLYQGDFVEDVPHGFGKLVYPNNKTLESFWNKGKPIGIALEQDIETQNQKSIFVKDSQLDKDPNVTLMDEES